MKQTHGHHLTQVRLRHQDRSPSRWPPGRLSRTHGAPLRTPPIHHRYKFHLSVATCPPRKNPIMLSAIISRRQLGIATLPLTLETSQFNKQEPRFALWWKSWPRLGRQQLHATTDQISKHGSLFPLETITMSEISAIRSKLFKTAMFGGADYCYKTETGGSCARILIQVPWNFGTGERDMY